MKPRKVKRLLQGFALGTYLFPWVVSFAAQEEVIWGKASDYSSLLKNFNLIQSSDIPKNLHLPPDLNVQKNPVHTLSGC